MSPIMSSKFKKIFTETEIAQERVYEIRIRDIRTNVTKNFSLFAPIGTEDKELPTLDDLKKIFNDAILEAKK